MNGVSKCNKCDNRTFRNELYDAYVCVICNSWVEEVCSDKYCEFCCDRPEKPFTPLENSVIEVFHIEHNNIDLIYQLLNKEFGY